MTQSIKSPVAIGVDIGGTNISAGLVTPTGKLIQYKTTPSRAFQGGPAVINRAKRLIKQIIAKRPAIRKRLLGIGVGCPGSIEPQQGMSQAMTPNIPKWRGLQIRKRLEQAFKVPVLVDNDAHAMAWGEKCWGAGKGADNIICLTLGTGIGGAIILNGTLYRGSNYYAGEIGHMKIGLNGPKCGCGAYGCLETFASGSGMVPRTIEAIKNGSDNTMLLKWTKGKLNKITARMIFDAARKHDYLATRIVKQTIHYLGRGIASLINIFDPELIILGGRISREGNFLFRPLRRIVKDNIMPLPVRQYRIVPSRLGDKAGLFGAAALVFHPPRQ